MKVFKEGTIHDILFRTLSIKKVGDEKISV